MFGIYYYYFFFIDQVIITYKLASTTITYSYGGTKVNYNRYTLWYRILMTEIIGKVYIIFKLNYIGKTRLRTLYLFYSTIANE